MSTTEVKRYWGSEEPRRGALPLATVSPGVQAVVLPGVDGGGTGTMRRYLKELEPSRTD